MSREDELVKDADKLWRYTESAVRICHSWMELTPEAYMDWVGSEIDRWLFTDAARQAGAPRARRQPGGARRRAGPMSGALDGRCAVITGAGGGLGRAFALGFARAGARVVAADLDGEAAVGDVRGGRRRGRRGTRLCR